MFECSRWRFSTVFLYTGRPDSSKRIGMLCSSWAHKEIHPIEEEDVHQRFAPLRLWIVMDRLLIVVNETGGPNEG